MDPTLILILAWALGQMVKDLHASEWVSTAIGSNFKVEYIPVMAAVLACLMSYATGSVSQRSVCLCSRCISFLVCPFSAKCVDFSDF